MNSDAFKDIEKLETDLWEAADRALRFYLGLPAL